MQADFSTKRKCEAFLAANDVSVDSDDSEDDMRLLCMATVARKKSKGKVALETDVVRAIDVSDLINICIQCDGTASSHAPVKTKVFVEGLPPVIVVLRCGRGDMFSGRCKKQIISGLCVGCGQASDAALVYYDYFFEVRVRDWINEKDIMALNVATKGGTTDPTARTRMTPHHPTPHHQPRCKQLEKSRLCIKRVHESPSPHRHLTPHTPHTCLFSGNSLLGMSANDFATLPANEKQKKYDKIIQMPFLVVASVSSSSSNGQFAKWVFDTERVPAGSPTLKAALGRMLGL